MQAKAKREQLTYSGDYPVLANLAGHYSNPSVGQITVSDKNGEKWIKAGFVEGPIATQISDQNLLALPAATTEVSSLVLGSSAVQRSTSRLGRVAIKSHSTFKIVKEN